MARPNKIVLNARGRHEEYKAAAILYPGMLVDLDADRSLVAHSVQGGPALVRVVKEESLRGLTILDAVCAIGDQGVPVHEAVSGDELLMLLKNGQNVAKNDPLMSAGDGTLIANPGMQLANIVAPSSNITNTNVETTFSNGSYSIGANTLQVGDKIRIKWKAFCSGQNSTDTHRVRLYIGSTTLQDTGALALDPNDWVAGDMTLTIRTIGSSGTFIATGYLTTVVATVVTTTTVTIASTTLDTTAAATITVKSLASAISTGNIIRLDEFSIDLFRDYGIFSLVMAKEAVDNSAGGEAINDAAFIRVKTIL